MGRTLGATETMFSGIRRGPDELQWEMGFARGLAAFPGFEDDRRIA